MVERTDPFEGKVISSQKLKALNATHCRILIKLVPNFGDDFPKYNLSYLSQVLGLNNSYIQELLDFLVDKDVVSFDGENYYLTSDNLWKIADVINLQPAVILKNKLQAMEDG